VKIKILQQSHATIVAPIHGVWRGVHRTPAGWFETQHTPPADSHVRIGTVRRGVAGRGL
jgi:hypothetical protein